MGRRCLPGSKRSARLPDWLDERVALAALDVAGAAPQVARLVRPAIACFRALGCGGKSGLLVAAAARRGGAACVVGIERRKPPRPPRDAWAPVTRRADRRRHRRTRDPAAVDAGDRARWTSPVSCVNVADAEMSAILPTRDGGTIYFFSMATSFTRAALGAEGVSRDVRMLVGNGYCPGHADATLALLRDDPVLASDLRGAFLWLTGARRTVLVPGAGLARVDGADQELAAAHVDVAGAGHDHVCGPPASPRPPGRRSPSRGAIVTCVDVSARAVELTARYRRSPHVA